MSRIITMTGFVGTEPEARHGKNADYVKMRFGTKEYGEGETWWFNLYCYGKNAKIALDKIKVGDNLMVTAELLPPLDGKSGGELAIAMLDFKWLPREQRVEQQSSKVEEFEFSSFDEIPEIPFTRTAN